MSIPFNKRLISLYLLFIPLSCGGKVIHFPEASRENVVSYEVIQSFRPARGSVAGGYSAAALNQATKLSEVRTKCGVPIGEWEEPIPFFAKVKRLKYKAHDAHRNVLTANLTFVYSGSDLPLIAVDYER
jgi:hypothetical protein